MLENLFFEVMTPIGFRIRITSTYWKIIVTIKHPSMNGREGEVKNTLSEPDEIRRSRSDPDVYLFYKKEKAKRWICAIAKKVDDRHGFLITTYSTEAIKEGEIIWKK
ncbi:MAG: DUF4258 domain-containing protein [bacterium]